MADPNEARSAAAPYSSGMPQHGSDDYTPTTDEIEARWMEGFEGDAGAGKADRLERYDQFQRWLAEHDAQVRAETVEYVAQIATETLRMCQAGGVGEKNILPPEKEAGFQLCIDNIANLAKSMKEEGNV